MSKLAWFGVHISVFTLLNGLALYYIKPGVNILTQVSPMVVVLFGMAVYRGADLISTETVTQVLRAPFVDLEKVGHGAKEIPKKEGLVGSIGDLVTCPSCTGAWLGALLVYGYLLWPQLFSVIIFTIAVSGLERFFRRSVQVIARLAGAKE